MAALNAEAPRPEQFQVQRERRRFSEGMDPVNSSGWNIDIERLQRLADEGQRVGNRLCLWVGPCKNPFIWAVVGTLAVGIGGLAVYGLTQVLVGIL